MTEKCIKCINQEENYVEKHYASWMFSSLDDKLINKPTCTCVYIMNSPVDFCPI